MTLQMPGMRTAIILAAAIVLGGCKSSNTPTNEIFVLVDLSETWHNTAQFERNKRVLEEVGEGVVSAAADSLTPPLAVQYRIIGGDSYERPPVCDVVYRPQLVNTSKAKPSWLITKAKSFQRYLGVDCVEGILALPPEPLTEVSAALASVAAKPRSPETKRTLIVISDFLEETSAKTPLTGYDLRGVRVLLLYRPITRETAASTLPRVAEWRAVLEGQGAKVEDRSDTALKRTDVTEFLVGR